MNNISIHLKGYYVHVSNHMVNKDKPNNIPFTPSSVSKRPLSQSNTFGLLLPRTSNSGILLLTVVFCPWNISR